MPDTPLRQKVFVDGETTGLDRNLHEMVELAWAVDDAPTAVAVLPHTLRNADPRALEVNRYYERNLDDVEKWDYDAEGAFMRAAAGNTLVGANVAFDAGMLAERAGYASWHYRMLDIESAAMLILGFDEVPGLRQIRDRLTELGYELPAPDHTAGGDVDTLRAVWRHLNAIARHLLRHGVPRAEALFAAADPRPDLVTVESS